MARPKRNENECPICGEYIQIASSGYLNHPFVDGKKYDAICLCCASTLKGSFTIAGPKNPPELHSLQEMIEDGFDKKNAEKSLKLIKKALKK